MDLQVKADVDGFSHLLVVKSRAAAENKALAELSFPISTSGLSMKSTQGGNLEANDANGGTIFTASPPMMWDSSGSSAAQHAGRRGRLARGRPARGDGPAAGGQEAACSSRTGA